MSFRRPPLETLFLSGSPLDIALALGRRRRHQIKQRVAYWEQQLAKLYRHRRPQLRELETALLRAAQRFAPKYVEEIRAMAEGAGLGFGELFRLNLTELNSYVDKCTDLILPIAAHNGKRILLAHNEDWDPRRNDLFLLRAKLPELEYAVLAYDGYLPGLSAGINSMGLVHSVNYLPPLDRRVGLPRIFVTRHLVTSPSIQDCLKFIASVPRAFGQAIHLAEQDRYLGIELTARRVALRQPSLPACHTNHYLAKKLQAWAGPPGVGSKQRLATTRRLLKESWEQRGELSSDQARTLAARILSDRSGNPWALWREADHPEESSATLAMALVGTDRLGMEVYRNRPSENKPVHLPLDRP